MAKWFYYDQAGKRIGPVSGPQIKSRVDAGEMAPETAVFTEDGLASVAGKIQGLSPKTPENEAWFHSDVDQGRESGWSNLLFYARLLRDFSDFCVALSVFITFGVSIYLSIFFAHNFGFSQSIGVLVVSFGSVLVTVIVYCLVSRFLYNFVCLKVSEEYETRRQTMLLKEILILLRRQNGEIRESEPTTHE